MDSSLKKKTKLFSFYFVKHCHGIPQWAFHPNIMEQTGFRVNNNNDIIPDLYTDPDLSSLRCDHTSILYLQYSISFKIGNVSTSFKQ